MFQINQICYEKANVHIQNRNEVERKIEGLITGGKNALQVAVDVEQLVYDIQSCDMTV